MVTGPDANPGLGPIGNGWVRARRASRAWKDQISWFSIPGSRPKARPTLIPQKTVFGGAFGESFAREVGHAALAYATVAERYDPATGTSRVGLRGGQETSSAVPRASRSFLDWLSWALATSRKECFERMAAAGYK